MNYVSLPCIPTMLRKRSQKIVKNALLYDRNTKMHINSDVAAQMNLYSEKQKDDSK